MKRSTLYYSLAAVLLYCLFLVSNLPASQAWQWFSPKLQDVRLQGIEGTIWSGHAAQLTVRGIPLGKAAWRIFPLQLLLGHLAVKWHYQNGSGSGEGILRVAYNGDIRAGKTHMESDLTILRSLLPQMPVMLAGEVKLDITSAEIHQGMLTELTGGADWLGGRTVSPVESDIGSFHAVFSTQKQAIQAKLSDVSGPLSMQGILRLQPKGGYSFIADLKPRAGASAALLDALQQIARPSANGGFTLEYRGQL